MTSAVLPSTHKGQWGDHTRNYTHHNTNFRTLNPNPNSTYNQNPNSTGHDRNLDHVRRSNEPPPPPVSSESSRDGQVIFHLDSYSRSELKELKNRFVSDLDRVRRFINEIEARESEFKCIHSVSPPPIPVIKKGNSVKKSGNITGQKRTMQGFSDRETKRPMKATVLNSTATLKVETAMMRMCGQILAKLMKHKHGWVFNKPVDVVALGLYNYHQVIKHPMDLGTVKLKLGKHIYGTPLDFAADVRLTFDNAMVYNPEGDEVHTMATNLLKMFDEMFQPAYRKFEAEHQRIIVAQQKFSKPLAKSTEHDTEKPVHMHKQAALCDVPPPVVALPTKSRKGGVEKSLSMQKRTVPVVKANARIGREMSDGEREKLGFLLQDLAGEYINDILQIVAKRNSEMAAPGEDGEVELDVHALDSETMWDLDRFARLHKKAAENRTRKELTSQSTLTLENNKKSPVVMRQEPAIPTMLNVEEDIDIGDEMPMNDYPPVEIERDDAPNPTSNVRSSNSSSSSSGTDSSSDSDSSSGSDSEDSVLHDAA